jgi:DNA ligase-1
MQYSRLADCYEELESTQSTLEKSSIMADLFQEADPDDLEILAHLVMGRAFPAWNDLDLGIGSKLMVNALARTTGIAEQDVEDAWREKGDLGDVAEEFVGRKKQQTLASKELTVELVQDNLEEMAQMSGANSQDRKIGKIAELLGFATPQEAKYVVRTVLESMRVGVGEGLVRNAIVEAFFSEIVAAPEFPQKLEFTGKQVAIAESVRDTVTDYGLFDTFEDENDITYVTADTLELADFWRHGGGHDSIVLPEDAVATWEDRLEQTIQHAYDVTTDFGDVAKIAATDGPAGLDELDIELFRPIKVMLAQKAETMEDGFDAVGNSSGEAILEYKYDGMRVQIHKQGDDVKVFTRRLEEVTTQFPDIVQAVKNNVSADECIIEGEAVAYDPDDKSKIPFQQLSKRIKRKYKIQQMVQEIPVTVYLFDVIYIDGDSMIDASGKKRWEAMKDIVDPEDYAIEFADHLETDDMDEAQTFYQESLNEDQEGIMLKNMDAAYQPGSRVGYMMKLKPVMETLDLVIVEADWGEGRRNEWLGSYTLACRDPETGELQTVGKMATGFTDRQLDEMTERLEPLIQETAGRHVILEPEVVVEVAYEEIQQSPQYESGYALRFPRLVQVREDMAPSNANEAAKIERLYDQQ